MKAKSIVTVAIAALLSLSLVAMMGCSSPAPAPAAADSGVAADSGAAPASTGTASTGTASTGTAAPAGGTIDKTWQGSWFSVSEILPPEEQTDKYEIVIQEDGSFVLNEDGEEVYTGTIEVTNQPEENWGDATIDGSTIKVQLVNAQGIYKFIFNAGDDWDKSLKKIIFQR